MQRYFILPGQDSVPAKLWKKRSQVNVDFFIIFGVYGICYYRLQDEMAAKILVDF